MLAPGRILSMRKRARQKPRGTHAPSRNDTKAHHHHDGTPSFPPSSYAVTPAACAVTAAACRCSEGHLDGRSMSPPMFRPSGRDGRDANRCSRSSGRGCAWVAP